MVSVIYGLLLRTDLVEMKIILMKLQKSFFVVLHSITMKVPFRISFFCSILLVLHAGTDLYAQWNKVAPLFINDSVRQGGAGVITFSDGIIWVGVNAVFSSDDTGRSWQKRPFPALSSTIIRDIYFLDKWHGLIATSDEGVLRTDDGGTTWKTILSTTGDILKASFNGSTDIIHALGVDQGTCYTSMDGGITWNQSYIAPYVSCLAISPNRTIYVFAQQKYKTSTRGWISYSTDLGSTWIKSAGLADGDSYTLTADSCDPNKLYLLNEDWISTLDWLSQIFVTSDRGDSWQAFDPNSVPYLNGSLASTRYALYAGTTSYDGVIRSTDKGITWTAIGGPETECDSRTVAAINDNTVFVLDAQGNVWATFNGGGKPFTAPSPDASLHFSSTRIINDSQNITIHLPIYLHHSGSTVFGADMIMHYTDTVPLKFVNAVLYNGKSFDVPGSSSPGRVELQVSASDLNAISDSLLGYANFQWKPGEYSCNYITFYPVRAIDPCSENQTESFQGIIGSVVSCNFSGVAERYLPNTQPAFSFSPNPAGEYGILTSQSYSGDVRIKLYDISGKLIMSLGGSVYSGDPFRIPLSNLAAGLYHLHISGKAGESEIPFIHR
ncbi:MAG: T9SS type A sorting domain-containing protein [Candidatus Kapaibacterium sp.]